jgi:hypothetical protein
MDGGGGTEGAWVVEVAAAGMVAFDYRQ